eukprot:GHVT01072500.1.p3 GENE.GHVT01072500.1~~GHVT01072500.1.p3  ORF type:complete len:141 (-),score=16.04 GHVT01072500.1:1500-1922(-)
MRKHELQQQTFGMKGKILRSPRMQSNSSTRLARFAIKEKGKQTLAASTRKKRQEKNHTEGYSSNGRLLVGMISRPLKQQGAVRRSNEVAMEALTPTHWVALRLGWPPAKIQFRGGTPLASRAGCPYDANLNTSTKQSDYA